MQELLALTTMDLRFYLGTYTDYSTAGQTATPSGLVFNRLTGQVVSVATRETDDILNTTCDVAIDTAFSFEVTIRQFVDGSNIGARVWANGNTTPYVYYDSTNDRYTWDTSAGLVNTGNGSAYVGDVVHLAGTRSATGTTTLYLRSTRGYVVAAAALSAEAITNMSLFNRPLFNREAPSDCSLFRVFSDVLTEEEVARLYAHSRIQLWPGAPKRSGIVSPI